jgi:hypothetical protein
MKKEEYIKKRKKERKMSSEAQIKKIHALRDALSIDEGDYRAAISGFTTSEGKPVQSSKEMSVGQASSFIGLLERVSEKTPSVRSRLYASPKQTRFIASLWRNVSRAKDPEGRRKTLDAFLSRRFHVRRSDRIPRSAASGVIKSLRKMNERQRILELRRETGKIG